MSTIQANKTANTIGIAGGILAFLGGIFKIMSWPGAQALLLLGVAIAVVYLVLWFINDLKFAKDSLAKAASVLLFVTLLVAAFGLVFKLSHYPGGRLLVMVHLGLLFLLVLPTQLLYLKKVEDGNMVNGRIGFLVFYLVFTTAINMAGTIV